MSLRNRIGAFFLLTGAIFLFIFAASVFSPTGSYELLPLFGGAALVVIGLRWRLAKGGGPPRAAAPAASTPPPPPKKQGPLGALLKGPASKKMQPKAAAPGGPPAGGGKPGSKPGGGPPGGGGAPKGNR